MNIGVTGPSGFLGKKLVKNGACPIVADITNEDWIANELDSFKIEVLIHAAALTNVDYCEKNTSEAFNVNVGGTMNVTNACSALRIPIIFLSTEHVFPGHSLFQPNERTKPNPKNVYGFTKYAGEVMIASSSYQTVVVRSSKLFDGQWLKPELDLLKAGNKIEFPDMIRRCFLHANFFVDALFRLTETLSVLEQHDIFHISSPVRVSYYSFWRDVCNKADISEDLLIKRTVQMEEGKLAPRPFYGGLDSRKAYKANLIGQISHQISIDVALGEYASIQ